MNDLLDQQAAMRARQAALGSRQGKHAPSQQGRLGKRSAGEAWLSQFMDYLIGERGCSQYTIRAYKATLDEFKESLAKDLLAGTTDDIRKFVLGILESGRSPMTARQKFSAVRSFYKFTFGENGILQDPSRHLHGPKAFKTIIRPITRGEVDRTLASIGTDHAVDMRNRAMVYVAYGSGLRVSELIRLRIADIDFQLNVAKVRLGKGSKDRLVPLNQAEIEAIRLYLDHARPRFSPGPHNNLLFVGRGSEPLTRQRVWQILTDLSQKAVGRPISPHKYRHAFVTDTINGGAAFRVVQKMVGHSSVKTTMAYMHDDPQRIRAEYLKSHPRGAGQ
jgi:integrase/recombinase XerD